MTSADTDLRILWLRPPKGNVSIRRERIAEHLRRRGVDIDFVDLSASGVASAVRATATEDYDVVLGNVRLGLYLGHLLARASQTPFIADVSDAIEDVADLPDPVFALVRRYELFVLRRADRAVYVPEAYRSYAEDGFDDLEGELLGNAVDFDRFASPEDDVVRRTGDILRAAGVDPDYPVAMYVGSLSGAQNVPAILDGAEGASDWQFVFIGEGPDQQQVQQAADEQPNVFYLGSFEYDLMPGFLSHATVALCLVDTERPLKVCEYGAAGLPTLGVRGKLQREFDHDELFYVDPDGESIATALQTLAADPDLGAAYGATLKERVREYSWTNVTAKYYDLICALSS